MKVIIAGSRNFTDFVYTEELILRTGFEITEIVSGCCRGVDTLGEKFALKHNIPLSKFPARWSAYGKSAGHRRNEEMAMYADALILIWDGESKGSLNMLRNANKNNLKVFTNI